MQTRPSSGAHFDCICKLAHLQEYFLTVYTVKLAHLQESFLTAYTVKLAHLQENF